MVLIDFATAVILAAMMGWPAVAADQRAAGGLIEAALAAGEFGPALRVARASSDVHHRDAYLAQVARAQARVGLGRGSLSTVAEISDDCTRTELLREFGSAGQLPRGSQGGGSQADFDALIELIQSTISPDTWDANGGAGSLQPFVGGVYVDPDGVLQLAARPAESDRLSGLRRQARPAGEVVDRPISEVADPGRQVPLRCVSINRLERQIQLREAAGLPPTEAMRFLGGLERVRYVFVYPASGDLVLAGPADSWTVDASGRARANGSGRPLVRLDDLIVALRCASADPTGRFGCAITPTQSALAKAHAFLRQSAGQPLRPGGRAVWLEGLRMSLGRQEISVFGVDPATHLAQVLVAADYRMKLIGMGLDPGVAGVPSYLDLIDLPVGKSPPPLSMLRWWFVLDDVAVVTTEDRGAFELIGQGVKVLSENELLTAQGQRVHTGSAEVVNRQFASHFTANFAALAVKYPIYAELQNVFDLALVAALMDAEDLPSQVGWHMTWFGDPQGYQIATAPPPTVVDTVINHRVIRRRIILAGASGGVSVDTSPFVDRQAIRIVDDGQLAGRRARAAREPPRDQWWWD